MKLIDKTNWPAGEWNDEPDRLELAKGQFHIVIIRQSLGHLCGYVGVPKNHPWHSVEYDSIEANVHGGLTFSDEITDCDPDFWYVGFDCAHFGDDCPSMTMLQGGRYKNIKYVMTECEILLSQAEAAIKKATE